MKKSAQFLCPNGWMSGYSKLLNFLIFSVQITPSPTICDSTPSPLGVGFQRIDFIYQFDIFAPDPGSSWLTQICARCHSGNALPWQLTAAES